jgi:hypothetical protein
MSLFVSLYYPVEFLFMYNHQQVIDATDDIFWDQFWSENVTNVQDIFTLIPAPEIRVLREEAPSNLATLCYKAVEKLVKAVDSSCRTQREHQTVLNCCRLLTRLLPYIFEDPDWKDFFWSSLPGKDDEESLPLAHSLLNALCVRNILEYNSYLQNDRKVSYSV